MTSRRGRRRPGGSALLLTLFTIAALLTLGTAFIGISIGESRQSAAEKNSLLARQLAVMGVTWATSYMADPYNLTLGNFDPNTGELILNLVGPNGGNGTFLGWSYKYVANNPNPQPSWTFTLYGPTANVTSIPVGASINNAAPEFQGSVDVTVTYLSIKGDTFREYNITATGHLFRTAAPTQEAATRTVVARITPWGPADNTIFEQNARGWAMTGINTNYPPGVTDPNYNADNTAMNNLLLGQGGKSGLNNAIGIPTGYTMDGNFRVDGGGPNTQFNANAGSIQVFASANELANRSVQFNGVTSFATGANNYYWAPNTNDGNSGIYGNNTPSFFNSIGLPSAGTYLNTLVQNPNVPGSYIPNPVNNPPGQGQWMTDALAESNSSGQSKQGYFKVSSSSASDFQGVDTTKSLGAQGITHGANIEYDTSGTYTQPGFAKYVVIFNPQVGNTPASVTIEKLGAYSNLPVADVNPNLSTANNPPALPLSTFSNGLMYFDGGNVEVKGTVPEGFSIIAAASSDRPTVYFDPNNPGTNPLIQYGNYTIAQLQQNGGPLSNSIYASPNDPLLKSATNTYALDPSTGRVYWPAWDPNTASSHGGNVLYDAPIVREGNLTVAGNLATTGTGALGLIAQNYVLLSLLDPQQNTSNPDQLNITNAVLFSMEQSVQWGGFLNPPTTGKSDYWNDLAFPQLPNAHPAWTPDMAGNGGVQIPINTARLTNTNASSVNVTGSIIGAYADVESWYPPGADPTQGQGGNGYVNQTFTKLPFLSTNPPPFFPEFDPKQTVPAAPYFWKVLSWSDLGSLSTQ